MDVQTAAVGYRTAELRRLAAQLRAERRRRGLGTRSHARRLVRLRVAIGRRLVAVGSALLEGTGARSVARTR